MIAAKMQEWPMAIRHGLAHLMLPLNIEGPTKALSWLEALLGESSSSGRTGEVSDV